MKTEYFNRWYLTVERWGKGKEGRFFHHVRASGTVGHVVKKAGKVCQNSEVGVWSVPF